MTQTLQQATQELREENEKIRLWLCNRVGKEKVEASIAKRLHAESNPLVLLLQKPENRILNKAAITSLQEMCSVTSQSV